jgi:hypothetical protein
MTRKDYGTAIQHIVAQWLSGGGIRGVFTASVLAQFETYITEQKGLTGAAAEAYSIAKHFDMICGTSIGGIIALNRTLRPFPHCASQDIEIPSRGFALSPVIYGFNLIA